MDYEQCYGLCQRYYGQVVRIEDEFGYTHVGRIVDLGDDTVWIQPVSQARFDGGFGYGGGYGYEYGYGYDYGYGYGAYGIAIGFIVGIAIAALFFF